MFRASGVRDAHAHRFRCHTLATEIFIKGGTIEDCANILDDSPEIFRKHYAKWSPEHQRRTVDILSRVHGTYTAQRTDRLRLSSYSRTASTIASPYGEQRRRDQSGSPEVVPLRLPFPDNVSTSRCNCRP